MFETSGVIDKEFYNKYAWALYWASTTKFAVIVWLCYVVFTVIIIGTLEEVVFCAIVMLLVILAIEFLGAVNYKRINLKRIVELREKPDYICTSHFDESEVVVKDQSSNAASKIKYDRFVKLRKCKSVYFLCTKTKLLVPIFVENFTDDEKEELLKFLKSKLVNVKKF